MDQYETLPIVPLRDVVVFPHMMMPFVIGRPSSTRALEHALTTDKRIFLAAQHDAAIDDPQPADIYTMGCVANIVQSLKLPDGNIKVLVEGVQRWLFDLAQERMAGEVRYHKGWPRPKGVVKLDPVALTGAWRELNQFRRSARHPLNQLLFLESLAAHYLRAMRTVAS